MAQRCSPFSSCTLVSIPSRSTILSSLNPITTSLPTYVKSSSECISGTSTFYYYFSFSAYFYTCFTSYFYFYFSFYFSFSFYLLFYCWLSLWALHSWNIHNVRFYWVAWFSKIICYFYWYDRFVVFRFHS